MKRIVVAALGVPLLAAGSIAGGWWLGLLVAGIQILALLEWQTITARMQWNGQRWLLAATVVLLDLVVLTDYSGIAVAGLLLSVLGMLLAEVFRRTRLPLGGMASSLVFLIYVALPLALWISLKQMPGAQRFAPVGPLLLLFLATWVCDSGAYCVGRAVGGAKLYPAASPNKTWAGFWGGLLVSAVVLPVARLLEFAEPVAMDFVALPLIVGVVGQIGDLLESLIKRQVEIKDSSGLLPGHGGILDRFDSLLFAAPAFVAYLILFPS
ncbi:phosphatidate cytidylyltransferase [candidate division KSB1 bacterium]|nr:phosphatidate cytidylyltransferase [candidate division KSB1 bacterium]